MTPIYDRLVDSLGVDPWFNRGGYTHELFMAANRQDQWLADVLAGKPKPKPVARKRRGKR